MWDQLKGKLKIVAIPFVFFLILELCGVFILPFSMYGPEVGILLLFGILVFFFWTEYYHRGEMKIRSQKLELWCAEHEYMRHSHSKYLELQIPHLVLLENKELNCIGVIAGEYNDQPFEVIDIKIGEVLNRRLYYTIHTILIIRGTFDITDSILIRPKKRGLRIECNWGKGTPVIGELGNDVEVLSNDETQLEYSLLLNDLIGNNTTFSYELSRDCIVVAYNRTSFLRASDNRVSLELIEEMREHAVQVFQRLTKSS